MSDKTASEQFDFFSGSLGLNSDPKDLFSNPFADDLSDSNSSIENQTAESAGTHQEKEDTASQKDQADLQHQKTTPADCLGTDRVTQRPEQTQQNKPDQTDQENQTTAANDTADSLHTERVTQRSPTVLQNSQDQKKQAQVKADEEPDGSSAWDDLGNISQNPYFRFEGIEDEITDRTMTFEQLRTAKSIDFPALDDASRVKWTVQCGKIQKQVTDTKKNIHEFTTEFKKTKEYKEALRTSSDKALKTYVKPSVSAQKKGVLGLPAYKGVFRNLQQAQKSEKRICNIHVPGAVYQLRKTDIADFFTLNCLYSKRPQAIDPFFKLHIPKVPAHIFNQIVGLFQNISRFDGEAVANILWDSAEKEYFVYVPRQLASKTSVQTTEDLKYCDDRYKTVVECHSHNTMPAHFSAQDNRDEKASRFYLVAGRFDSCFPSIQFRASSGGVYFDVKVWDLFDFSYPDEWDSLITFAPEMPGGCYESPQ